MAQRASAMEGRDAVSPEDFDACCRTLRSWLLACIRRWGVPIQVAEEIAQDALVRLWRKGKAVENPTAYLYKVAENLAKDYWTEEKPGRHVSLDELPWEPAAPAPPNPDQPDDARARTAARRVKRLLKGLPKQQRKAMQLVYIEGLSHREAAKKMGISEKTERSHVGRAKATLREAGMGPRSTKNERPKKVLE